MTQKKLRLRFAIIILVILSCMLVMINSLKTPFLSFYLDKKIDLFQEKHGICIAYSDVKINGLNRVTFHNFSANRIGCIHFAKAKRIEVYIPTWKILSLNLKPKFVGIDSLEIEVSHYLTKPQKNDEQINSLASIANQSVDNPKHADKLIDIYRLYRLLSVIPWLSIANIEINHFNLKYQSGEINYSLSSEQICNLHGILSSILCIKENENSSTIELLGNSMLTEKGINIKIKTLDSNKIHLPANLAANNLTLEVDSIYFSLYNQTLKHDSIHLIGVIEMLGLQTYHRHLSENDVYVKYAGVNFSATATPVALSLDSTTHIAINKIIIPVELAISNKLNPKLRVKVKTGEQNAADLFESIPHGLFSTLEGIKIEGRTCFDFVLSLDFNQPDSLEFYAKLSPIDFKLLAMGNHDFRMVNDTFSYTIMNSDSLLKVIKVNPENRNYRSLDQISSYLKNAVITAEDGSFYYHKGFDPDGFKYALVQNIKQKQLTRGGSTITMQLVKNLYLNRNKNILRKAEESIIVWLIETQQLVAKDRILEIYLNIIDWGPNINGIYEASLFYFQKDPFDLQLNEAIFLASIIPSPVNFMHNFDSLGNLKNHMENYYNFVAGKMFERDMITAEELEVLEKNVTLTRSASKYLNRKCSSDSCEINYWNSDN